MLPFGDYKECHSFEDAIGPGWDESEANNSDERAAKLGGHAPPLL